MRPVNGVLPVALHARDAGRKMLVPQQNSEEAVVVEQAQIFPAAHLLEVCAHLTGQQIIEAYSPQPVSEPSKELLDFVDVHGQFHVKRAFEIAASGNHNLLTSWI